MKANIKLYHDVLRNYLLNKYSCLGKINCKDKYFPQLKYNF